MFLVGFPCSSAGFDQIWQADRIDVTVSAIGSDAEGVPGYHGNIVGQAGVANGVMLGKQRVILRPAIEVGHLRITDHCGELFVLQDDDGNVAECWHCPLRSRCRGRC